jgi:hypothetical protein
MRRLKFQIAFVAVALLSSAAAASSSAHAQTQPSTARTNATAVAAESERPPAPSADAKSPQANGRHQHEGLMIRFAVGPSYSTGEQEIEPAPIVTQSPLPNIRVTGSGALSISGKGLMLSFDIGAHVARNFILFFRGTNNVRIGPSVSASRRDISDATLNSQLVGLGLTYYVMPANVALTAVGGLVAAHFEYVDRASEKPADADIGTGLQADLGKEFWVGDDWAIAFTGRFTFESVPVRSEIARSHLVLLGGALLFGMTYQ